METGLNGPEVLMDDQIPKIKYQGSNYACKVAKFHMEDNEIIIYEEPIETEGDIGNFLAIQRLFKGVFGEEKCRNIHDGNGP